MVMLVGGDVVVEDCGVVADEGSSFFNDFAGRFFDIRQIIVSPFSILSDWQPHDTGPVGFLFYFGNVKHVRICVDLFGFNIEPELWGFFSKESQA